MTQFYVAGGRQKSGPVEEIEDFRHFQQAVLVEVDVETGSLEPRVESVSPPEHCAAEEPSFIFKTATLEGGRLYIPTETEVLVYDVPGFRRTGYVSLPGFNDVHHVRPTPSGTLLVANTGLDMVIETELAGVVHNEWSVTDEELWTRFSRDIDYRRVFSTKPHKSHPNHVTLYDGGVWVTRFEQGDCLCLTSEREPISVADARIHDGRVIGDTAYFTVVSGHVVELDMKSGRVMRRTDLNEVSDHGLPLGWCRGIEILDEDHVVVGFTRLRPTKWTEYVTWVKRHLGGSGHRLLPTRIAMFDLRRGMLCWEVDVEPAGVNAVFSIHRVPSAGS